MGHAVRAVSSSGCMTTGYVSSTALLHDLCLLHQNLKHLSDVSVAALCTELSCYCARYPV